MPKTTVSFDRIGRNHTVTPLVVTDTDDWDEIAESIHRYARPYLRSRDIEVKIYDHGPDPSITGIILCGFQNGGTFTCTTEET